MTSDDITVALIVLVFAAFGVVLFAVSTWVNLPQRRSSARATGALKTPHSSPRTPAPAARERVDA